MRRCMYTLLTYRILQFDKPRNTADFLATGIASDEYSKPASGDAQVDDLTEDGTSLQVTRGLFYPGVDGSDSFSAVTHPSAYAMASTTLDSSQWTPSFD